MSTNVLVDREPRGAVRGQAAVAIIPSIAVLITEVPRWNVGSVPATTSLSQIG